MARIADLEALIGPPAVTPPAVDWGRLEQRLGTRLPSDYKEIAGRYVTLRFDDFLGWFHPGDGGDLDAYAEGMLQALTGLSSFSGDRPHIDLLDDEGRASPAPAFALYPEPGGALQWGMTDNGDRCVWLTGPDPEKWRIGVFYGRRWWVHEGGLLEFLVGLLSRQISCPIFPGGFPESTAIQELAPDEFVASEDVDQ